MSETNQDNRELSPEEIKAYRMQMTEFYKTQIPTLKLQKEYETLLADIEEARAKRMTMTIRMAQMMAGPPQEPEGTDDKKPEPSPEQGNQEGPKPERKLKTE